MEKHKLGQVLLVFGIMFLALGLFISTFVITPRIDTHIRTQTVLVDDFKYHDGMLVYNNTEFHHIKSMSVTNGSNGTVALTYATSTTVRDRSVSEYIFGTFAVVAITIEIVGFIMMGREENE